MGKAVRMATAYMIISLAACIVFVSIMVLAAVIDLNTLRIPNSLIAAACVVWVAEHVALLALSGLFASAWEVMVFSGDFLTALSRVLAGLFAFTSGFGSHAPTIGEALAGALVLGGGSLVVSMVYERVSGKPSMGGGDIKLLFVAGLYLGWWRGFFCVMIACIAFLIISALLPRIGWCPPVCASERESLGNDVVVMDSALGDGMAVHSALNDGIATHPFPSDGAADSSSRDDAEEEPLDGGDIANEEPFGFPFAPAIAIGALIALVLP